MVCCRVTFVSSIVWLFFIMLDREKCRPQHPCLDWFRLSCAKYSADAISIFKLIHGKMATDRGLQANTSADLTYDGGNKIGANWTPSNTNTCLDRGSKQTTLETGTNTPGRLK